MEILDNIHDERIKFKYYLNPLGSLTLIALGLAMAAFVFRMICVIMVYSMFPTDGKMLDFAESMRLQWWAYAIDYTSVVYLFLFIVSLIPFFIWIFRVYSNLDHVKLRGLNVTPGWAVGWFFIPFANLYYMPQILNDILRGTKHRELNEPINNSIEYQNVAPWGVIWLVVRMLGGILAYMGLASFIKNPEPSKFQSAAMIEFVSMSLILASGIIIFGIVASITKRQNYIYNNL